MVGGVPNSHLARHSQRVLKLDGGLEEVGVVCSKVNRDNIPMAQYKMFPPTCGFFFVKKEYATGLRSKSPIACVPYLFTLEESPVVKNLPP